VLGRAFQGLGDHLRIPGFQDLGFQDLGFEDIGFEIKRITVLGDVTRPFSLCLRARPSSGSRLRLQATGVRWNGPALQSSGNKMRGNWFVSKCIPAKEQLHGTHHHTVL
jgi:hypothetical protein